MTNNKKRSLSLDSVEIVCRATLAESYLGPDILSAYIGPTREQIEEEQRKLEEEQSVREAFDLMMSWKPQLDEKLNEDNKLSPATEGVGLVDEPERIAGRTEEALEARDRTT